MSNRIFEILNGLKIYDGVYKKLKIDLKSRWVNHFMNPMSYWVVKQELKQIDILEKASCQRRFGENWAQMILTTSQALSF